MRQVMAAFDREHVTGANDDDGEEDEESDFGKSDDSCASAASSGITRAYRDLLEAVQYSKSACSYLPAETCVRYDDE